MANDPLLHLLGLARKAGRLEIGEEPVGAACRARHARLILLACDAAPNTCRRAAHFGQAGNVLWLEIPFTKAELGFQLGRGSCAMLALTDTGFAASLVEKLAAKDPEHYQSAAEQLRQKAQRVLQRQQERRQHEKNLRQGKHKPWAPPPPPTDQAKRHSPGVSTFHMKPKSPGQSTSARQKQAGTRQYSRPQRPGPGGRRLSGSIPKKRGGSSL
ncbi:MAG: L7Ae/L30e/S12e/Gadd45 family ribosomal protein [Lawsonibacter sp.]|jgi:ribosomal protein L7Ae-like RNA K-turn-binding protein